MVGFIRLRDVYIYFGFGGVLLVCGEVGCGYIVFDKGWFLV